MPRSLERLPVSETGYSLPATDVLTGRGFITGKSGSGKSNTASVVAEELLERGLGLLIVDTDGEYHGLGERYDLLHVGAGEDCDRTVEPGDGGVIADTALGENVPVVLDVSGFLEEEAAREVIHDVVRALFVAEDDYTKPFLLFLEEAHEFIPQRGGGDDLSAMLIRVAKRGRKRGLGICAMSQRPAAVDKDYITQCDWLVWHRLTWETDTDVAGRILGGDAAETVQSLSNGEALVRTDWDESIRRVQFRRKRTRDAGSTPDVLEAYGPRTDRDDHRADESADGAGDEALEETPTSPDPPDPAPAMADRSSTTEDRSTTTEDRSTTTEDPSPAASWRRRRAVESPERFDPLWELGLLLVYLYDSAVLAHGRARRRLEGALDRHLAADERVLRLVSAGAVLALYGLALALVALAVAG